MNKQEYFESLKGKKPMNMPNGNTRHGMRHKSEYSTYYSMRYRCYSPKSSSWKNYGAKGIRVCDRWLEKGGFVNFLDDMGCKPTPKHTLDRIDNSGNYSPTNCRWATYSEQAKNKSYPKLSESHKKNIGIGSKRAWERRKR